MGSHFKTEEVGAWHRWTRRTITSSQAADYPCERTTSHTHEGSYLPEGEVPTDTPKQGSDSGWAWNHHGGKTIKNANMRARPKEQVSWVRGMADETHTYENAMRLGAEEHSNCQRLHSETFWTWNAHLKVDLDQMINDRQHAPAFRNFKAGAPTQWTKDHNSAKMAGDKL